MYAKNYTRIGPSFLIWGALSSPNLDIGGTDLYRPIQVGGFGLCRWEPLGLGSLYRSFKTFYTTMSEVDETAKLWKVNRTVHELVKDRVSNDWGTSKICLSPVCLLRAFWSPTMKSTWTCNSFARCMPTTAALLSE